MDIYHNIIRLICSPSISICCNECSLVVSVAFELKLPGLMALAHMDQALCVSYQLARTAHAVQDRDRWHPRGSTIWSAICSNLNITLRVIYWDQCNPILIHYHIQRDIYWDSNTQKSCIDLWLFACEFWGLWPLNNCFPKKTGHVDIFYVKNSKIQHFHI